jgi:hypothetical protein
LRTYFSNLKAGAMRRSLLLALVGLGGCAQPSGDFPSLLPRAVEGQSLAEPDRPVVVAAKDPSLDAKINAIVSSLDDAEKRFTAAAQEAEAQIAVARGVAVGSDRWLDAQVALGALDSLRGPVATAQADLEQLIIDRGAAGQPPYPALRSAADRANALSASQGKRIAALEAALGGV